MAFKDYCSDGKCDVCGKETQVVVCSGGYGPISNAYCEECLNKIEVINALNSDEIGFHCGEIDCQYHTIQHCLSDKCKYE